MGQPPQGYIANQLGLVSNAHSYTIKPGTAALSVFLDGVEIWAFKQDKGFAQGLDGTGYITVRNGNTTFSAAMGQFDGTLTAGEGLPVILGIDNRTGLVAADGAPITLFTIPAGITAPALFRISADIFATVVSAGTANYTITWTENGGARTAVVSASVVNTLATLTDLINPDATTAVTAQLTFAGFTGTVKVASSLELLAHG